MPLLVAVRGSVGNGRGRRTRSDREDGACPSLLEAGSVAPVTSTSLEGAVAATGCASNHSGLRSRGDLCVLRFVERAGAEARRERDRAEDGEQRRGESSATHVPSSPAHGHP